MMKKYELTKEFIEHCGRRLFRIRALIDFGNVKAGDLGGYVEKEENLSQEGNAPVDICAFMQGVAEGSTIMQRKQVEAK